MNGWTVPIGLDPRTPRKVKMSSAYQAAMILVFIVFVFPAGTITVDSLLDLYKRSALQERGVAIDGKVVDLYITHHKGNLYHLKYRFWPKERLISPESFVEDDAFISDNDYNALKVDDIVPIIYDPLNPERSELEVNDLSPRDRPLQYNIVVTFLAILAPILTFIVSFIVFSIGVYLKERKLLRWGKAAPAMIFDDRQHSTGGGLPVVTYEFVDDTGTVVHGAQKYVPRRWDFRLRFTKYRSSIFNNPTVLFDPNNSTNNILYPPIIAELQ
jgi:hypothetical protein